jgi:hypothetical protein
MFKSDKDEKTIQLFIQLKKFALKNSLLVTLAKGDERLYYLFREGVTGGLSIVHHRENERG